MKSEVSIKDRIKKSSNSSDNKKEKFHISDSVKFEVVKSKGKNK
jgi:hypothetical protein